MREYIRLPKYQSIPDSSIKAEKLNDEFWKSQIFHHLLKFYKDDDFIELKKIITIESDRPRSQIEDVIKKYIRNYFNKNERFNLNGFIINREPSSEGKLNGFYDFKFQHSNWKNKENLIPKYFSFECKNIDNQNSSINEYVIVKRNKSGIIHYDGGVYRYFNQKYAVEQNFGGMIGFILSGSQEILIDKIITKINENSSNDENRSLSSIEIIRNSVDENKNTFESIHLRDGILFKLHHIFFDLN